MPSSFDLRDQGVVTPVKNQSPWGTCWGFGAIAAAETSILSEIGMTYEETGLDLSERHLAWFAYTALPDDDFGQGGEGTHSLFENPTDRLNSGGLPFMATSLFANGIGPNLEENVPYHGVDPETGEPTIAYDAEGNPVCYSPEDDWSVDESERFGVVYELEDSAILPSPAGSVTSEDGMSASYVYNEAGTIAMKEALLAGDAVEIAFFADTSMPGQEAEENHYINTDTWAHYTYEQVQANHTVTVVGWDDDYPKENFLEGHQPEHDGAWIVKNSWGATTEEFPNSYEWGVDGTGYFYISYYDQSLTNIETFNFDTEETGLDYSIANQYDYMPTSGVTSSDSDDPVRMANVFTAEEDQVVRTLSAQTAKEGVTVSYEVYLLDEDATGPTDGALMSSESQTYEHAGYHRIDLAKPVVALEGQRFSVVVTKRDASGLYQMNLNAGFNETGWEGFGQLFGIPSYSKAVVNEGESYIFMNGLSELGLAEGWNDWADVIPVYQSVSGEYGSWMDYDNFSIKAYADPLTDIAFPDVADGDWFADAVTYVAARGIMTGYGDGAGEIARLFGPLAPMERQDVAIMLYKYLAPEEYAVTSDPSVYGDTVDTTELSDVEDGMYYTPAVNWAYENGVMTGYAAGEHAGELGVGDTITREQFATILYRALAGEGEAAPGEGEGGSSFVDADDVSEFAREAMAWCVENGIIEGASGMLLPQHEANRAEVATMMMRIDSLGDIA